MTLADSSWDAERCLLVTRLQGMTSLEDVRRWKDSLSRALGRIAEGGTFRLLVDLFGYEYAILTVHKEMRSIVPLMLAAHGFRTALLDLFDRVDLPTTRTRGITCVAVAHVNHDVDKMAEYDRRLGRANERFFSDSNTAQDWIQSLH